MFSHQSPYEIINCFVINSAGENSSFLFIGKKRTYKIEPYESAEKIDMSEIDLEAVFGSLVFFYNLRNELQKTILNYLQKETVVEMQQEWVDSLLNGDGINPSMDSLMATSLESTALQKPIFTPV